LFEAQRLQPPPKKTAGLENSRERLFFVLLFRAGSWFIYFASRTALLKLGVQLVLIAGLVIYIS